MSKESEVLEVVEAMNYWLRDSKLNKHYELKPDLSTYLYTIVCKRGCHSGLQRVRIDEQGIYYWTYSSVSSFKRIDLKLADPGFFEKLAILLLKKCASKSNKTYRQS